MGMLVIEGNCVEAPPVPSLSVLPNNTLHLTFTKSLTRPLVVTDYTLLVADAYEAYAPSWNMTVLTPNTSYQIELSFSSTPPDTYSSLQLLFTDPNALKDSQGLAVSTFLLNVTLNPFPSLLSPTLPLVSALSPATIQAATATKGTASVVLTSAILGGNPTAMFSLLNQLQLLTYIPMINVTLPADLTNTMLGLSMSGLSFNLFGYVYDTEKASPSPAFMVNNGFESSLFLLNANSLVFTSAFLAISYLTVTLLSKLSYFPVLSQYFAHLQGQYEWGVPLRAWILLYLDAGLSSFLQFADYSWTQYGAKENGLLAGLCLCVFLLTPAWVLVQTLRYREKMLSRSDPTFNSRWGTLYNEFKPSPGLHSIAFYSYFLLRRCLYAISLVYLHAYPRLQVFTSLTSSLLVLPTQVFLYCAVFCPYSSGFSLLAALLSEGATFALFLLTASFLWIPAASAVGKVLGTVGVWSLYGSIAGNSLIALGEMVSTWRQLVRRFRRIMAQVEKERKESKTKSAFPSVQIHS